MKATKAIWPTLKVEWRTYGGTAIPIDMVISYALPSRLWQHQEAEGKDSPSPKGSIKYYQLNMWLGVAIAAV